jgi:hypothetical protein
VNQNHEGGVFIVARSSAAPVWFAAVSAWGNHEPYSHFHAGRSLSLEVLHMKWSGLQ